MKKTFNVLMVTALSAVLLVGCSSNKVENTAVNDTAIVAEVGSTDSTGTEQATGAEDSSATDATEEVATKVYPYTYVDAANREVVVDKEITRVAVDYLPLWETLYLLGVTPVAATGADNYLATWDAFNGYDMGEVTDLGSGEVNLELLLEMEPDMFLHQVADPSSVDLANFEAISSVAVFGPSTKMDWKLSLREVGKLIGKEEKAEEVITEFEEKITESRAKLEEAYAGETVLQMSIMGEDRYFYAYRPVLFDKETGLGLNMPEGHTSSENYEQITIEALVAMNPDHIFINVFDGNEALYEALQASTVWQSLKAVQSGNVTRIDGSGHASSAMAVQYTTNFIVDTLLADK